MPKDEPSHPPPLKRGDACLYCRKRRIRCSADKPTCQHCQKSGRECVYDSGKPISRVKQLEEKVAQLENLLQTGNGSGDGIVNEGRRESSSSTTQQSHPTPLQHHSSSGTSSQSFQMDTNTSYQQDGTSSTSYGYAVNSENFDVNMFETILDSSQPSSGTSSNPMTNNFASFGGSFLSGNSGSGAETGATPNFFGMNNPSFNNDNNNGGANSGPTIESLFDFNLLDPEYMNMITSFGSTSTGPSPATNSSASANSGYQQPSHLPPSASYPQSSQQTQLPFPPPSQASSTSQSISPPNGQFDPNDCSNNDLSFCPLYLASGAAVQNGPYLSTGEINNGTYSNRHNSTNVPQVNQDTGMLSEEQAQLKELIKSVHYKFLPTSDPNTLLTEVEQSMAPTSGPQKYTPLSSVEGTRTPQRWDDPIYKDRMPPQLDNPVHSLLLEVEKSVEPILGSGSNELLNPSKWINGISSNNSASDSNPPSTRTDTFDTSAYTGDTGTGTSTEGFTLVGGWYDAHDLPKVARDHLLDLFFSRMRLFGQEFHVPRFMAGLTLPAAKRPHPCLLYSMFTLASRLSDSPPIRQLEPHFYKIASSQLEQAIQMADRLLDATRASTLLAIYKFSKAAYHEGWMMTGQAARLAISCGLHQIHSSVFKPSSLPHIYGELSGIMRHRSYVLPPPQDAIELGERIWCFWSIYTTDRCSSISTQWPPAISNDDITTPFPRPLHEYELGLVTEQDDHQSVQSIYTPSLYHNPLPHYAETTLISIRLRSISILERASKLMYQPPEEGWEKKLPSNPSGLSSSTSTSSTSNSPSATNIDDYLYSQISTAAGYAPTYQRNTNSYPHSSSDSPTSNSSGGPAHTHTSSKNRSKEGWTRTARIRTPKAYEEVRQALLKIESDLPPEWRVQWWKWDGKVQEWHFTKPRKDLITLHFVLGCAWMFLFDVFSFTAENTDALNVAKRLTVTVKFVSSEVMSSDLDVFIAMTWSFISKILIREMKRLQSQGDIEGANSLESDIQVLVTALKEFGQRYTLGKMQAERTERYRSSTKAETDRLFKKKNKNKNKNKKQRGQNRSRSFGMNNRSAQEDANFNEYENGQIFISDPDSDSDSDSDDVDEEKYSYIDRFVDSEL